MKQEQYPSYSRYNTIDLSYRLPHARVARLWARAVIGAVNRGLIGLDGTGGNTKPRSPESHIGVRILVLGRYSGSMQGLPVIKVALSTCVANADLVTTRRWIHGRPIITDMDPA